METPESQTGEQASTMHNNKSTSRTQYRNSCDACNTAKVRCSKERPSCQRCERREICCVYSISLRSSKAHRNNAKNRDNTNTSRSGSINLDFNQLNGGHNDKAAMERQPTQLTMDTQMHDAGFQNFRDPFATATSIPQSMYDFSDSPAMSDINFEVPSFEEYFVHDSHLSMSDVPPSLTDPALLTAATNSLRNSLSPPSSTTSVMCSCQQSILSKLSELSLSGLTGSVNVPFDRALSENRSIVALCTSTLNCPTCAQRDDVMLTLTLSALLSHVLIVFDGMFKSRRESLLHGGKFRHGGSSQGSAVDGSDGFEMLSNGGILTPPGSTHGGSVRGSIDIKGNGTTTNNGDALVATSGMMVNGNATPQVKLSLGTYELDERDEQILQANLLKIELQKITDMVEGFERRFCRPGTTNVGQHTNNGASSGMDMGSFGAGVGGILANAAAAAVAGTKPGGSDAKLAENMVLYLKQRLRGNYEALKRLGPMFSTGQQQQQQQQPTGLWRW